MLSIKAGKVPLSKKKRVPRISRIGTRMEDLQQIAHIHTQNLTFRRFERRKRFILRKSLLLSPISVDVWPYKVLKIRFFKSVAEVIIKNTNKSLDEDRIYFGSLIARPRRQA
jgi:hypothetical protein